jgi:hypothetical protein
LIGSSQQYAAVVPRPFWRGLLRHMMAVTAFLTVRSGAIGL